MTDFPDTTIGIDIGRESRHTICVVDWSGGDPLVTELRDDADQAALVGSQNQERPRTVGIVCPFGWPAGFVEFVNLHTTHQTLTRQQWGELTMRATDKAALKAAGLRPSDVVFLGWATKILVCAGLIESLKPFVRRDGADRIIEVDARASYKNWSRSRLRDSPTMLRDLVEDSRLTGAPGDVYKNSRSMSAIVAAFTARAYDRGLTLPIPAASAAAALQEGWSHVPRRGSLVELAPRQQEPLDAST